MEKSSKLVKSQDLQEENIKLERELAYYKGFYEGVKEVTTLLGDGPIEITHNLNINGLEDEEIEEVEEEQEEKTSGKVMIGKIEGKNAVKFINLMKELGVE